MTKVAANAIATEQAEAYRKGAPDANGMPPERAVDMEGGKPCRHCLKYIEQGQEYLTLAHRPFDTPQPYAETGPIFLCAAVCERWEGNEMPPVLAESPEDRLLKGYSLDHRIVYGLGRIVEPARIAEQAADILQDDRVAYVHARSSTNNCFTCRIDPA